MVVVVVSEGPQLLLCSPVDPVLALLASEEATLEADDEVVGDDSRSE